MNHWAHGYGYRDGYAGRERHPPCDCAAAVDYELGYSAGDLARIEENYNAARIGA